MSKEHHKTIEEKVTLQMHQLVGDLERLMIPLLLSYLCMVQTLLPASQQCLNLLLCSVEGWLKTTVGADD